MSREYIYPKEALPELGYDEPDKQKCCGNCCHSVVTNPGAYISGLECKIIIKLFKKKKISNGNPQVSGYYGSCNYWDVPMRKIDLLKK